MKKSLSSAEITSATVTSATATTLDMINKKIQNATEGLSSNCSNLLHNRTLSTNKENTLIICDYVSSLKSEINPSDHYRKNTIILLCTFSIFFNGKPFNEITREDVLSFLDSFRKIESVDPLHKWIGTYNAYS